MKRIVYCVLLTLAACGGGGGDGVPFEMEPDDVLILPTYGYQISALAAAGPLTVSIPDEGGPRAVSVDFGNSLNGEVSVSVDGDNIATITDYSLRSLSAVAVDSDAAAAFLGSFEIEVIEDMQFLVGEPPQSGIFQVVTATETVTLQAFAGAVQVRFGDAEPITLTWDELAGLLDDPLAFDWQRRASLATGVLEFVFVQFLSVTETLNFVQDQLATINPLVVSCDAFTGAPPAGVLAQGESTFTWLGSGSVPSAGDDFQWAFTDCWLDDAIDTEDQLLNGSIDLNNYVEVIDAESRLIGTGFDQVIFNNLTITTTEENQPGVFTIDPDNTITVTGGFDLAFVGFTN